MKTVSKGFLCGHHSSKLLFSHYSVPWCILFPPGTVAVSKVVVITFTVILNKKGPSREKEQYRISMNTTCLTEQMFSSIFSSLTNNSHDFFAVQQCINSANPTLYF